MRWLFRFNTNYYYERALLTRCAAGDTSAQARFAALSYSSQVRRTAEETNLTLGRPLSAEELKRLCALYVTEIYAGAATFPHRRRTLYEQIHLYVFVAVLRRVQDG